MRVSLFFAVAPARADSRNACSWTGGKLYSAKASGRIAAKLSFGGDVVSASTKSKACGPQWLLSGKLEADGPGGVNGSGPADQPRNLKGSLQSDAVSGTLPDQGRFTSRGGSLQAGSNFPDCGHSSLAVDRHAPAFSGVQGCSITYPCCTRSTKRKLAAARRWPFSHSRKLHTARRRPSLFRR